MTLFFLDFITDFNFILLLSFITTFWVNFLKLCRFKKFNYNNTLSRIKKKNSLERKKLFTVYLVFSFCLSNEWVECSPIVWGTRFQSQVESYQRLKKWYLQIIKSVHLNWIISILFSDQQFLVLQGLGLFNGKSTTYGLFNVGND